MLASGRFRFLAVLLSLVTVFSVVTVDMAEARRGGSFGSRGIKTYQTVPATRTSPSVTAPINNSVTAPTSASRTGTPAPTGRPGLFGGGLMQGLFLGGLFGLFLGYGFGGFGGVLSLLFQVLLIGGVLWLLFGRRRMAMAGGPTQSASHGSRFAGERRTDEATSRNTATPIDVSNRDLDLFETRLSEVQAAVSREDRQALDRLATREVADVLGRELEDNAARGLRNEVLDVRMLGGSVAEAWREGTRDFATVAMRYESRDVMRDRKTGAIVSGAEGLTETTEIWTFVRERNGDWRVSAIQQA